MLRGLIENFVLGFAITAVPGAVFFETIRRTLMNRQSIASFLAGNFAGMFLIIAATATGLPILLADKWLAGMFYALSGGLLMYVGAKAAVSTQQYAARPSDTKKGALGAFLTGFVLATANPISIVFWISITGKLLQDYDSTAAVIANSISIVLGAMLVFAVLIAVVSKARTKLRARHFIFLARGFGLIIFLYGLITIGKIL